ncbi:NAD(P)H-dependent oxidoreductase [Cellvibrio sp. NN19]|uniref:NAD(P)H-dependent oxidoreductase n=1 Tax=Cellvibrio chitinivorans TaxID=3102792 RepID=UPI002B4013EA|nr:NAD(P)H-dependent oxidoreductase [Cellvibrio sp. NN19]
MRVLGFSGGLSVPSKTHGLVNAIVERFASRVDVDAEVIDLAQIATGFGGALYRQHLPSELKLVLEHIEAADVLVVASPVYRAAYPGLFKHVFDLVERKALEGKAIILAANGGSAHHALILESHLRPLFNSLGSFTVPTGIYTQASDFDGYSLNNAGVLERVDAAIDEVLRLQQGLRIERVTTKPAEVLV